MFPLMRNVQNVLVQSNLWDPIDGKSVETEGLPWWPSSKESTCSPGATGEVGSTPGLGRSPGGGHGNPLQYSCLENPHGQRCMVGYSPCGCKELNMSKRLKHSTSEGRRVDGPTEEMQMAGSLPEKLLHFLPNENKFGNLCGKTSRADASESVSFWPPLEWQSACLWIKSTVSNISQF